MPGKNVDAQPGAAQDLAISDLGAVVGNEALQDDAHAQDLVRVLGQRIDERLHRMAHGLIIAVGVLVRQVEALAFDGLAIEVERHDLIRTGQQLDADGDFGVPRKIQAGRAASAGRFQMPALDDEVLVLEFLENLDDGRPAEL